MRNALCLIPLLAALTAVSPLATAGLTLGLAAPLDKARDQALIEVRYFGRKWSHWSTSLNLWKSAQRSDQMLRNICSSLLTSWGRWRPSLGLCYGSTDPRLETKGKYRMGLDLALSPRWTLFYSHYSNCQSVCRDLPLPRGKTGSNKGLNFFGVSFKLGIR